MTGARAGAVVRLALRLSLVPGRRTRLRAVSLTASTALLVLVALTVASLLTAFAALQAVDAGRLVVGNPGADPTLMVAQSGDRWHGRPIVRLSVWSSPSVPSPPGLTRLPSSGQAALSDALLAAVSEDEALAARFPPGPYDRIGSAGTRSGDELVAWIGAERDVVAANASAAVGDRFAAGVKRGQFGLLRNLSDEVRVLVLAALAAALSPMIVLAVQAANVSAAAREDLLRLLRALGLSSSNVRTLVATELATWALVGTTLGALLFTLLRPAGLLLQTSALRWHPRDFHPGGIGWTTCVVLPVVLVTAASLATAAGRRDQPTDAAGRRSWLPDLGAGAGVAVLAGVAARPLRPEERVPLSVLVLALGALVLVVICLPRALERMTGLTARGLRPRSPEAYVGLKRVVADPRAATQPVLALSLGLLAVALTSSIGHQLLIAAAGTASKDPPAGQHHLRVKSLLIGTQPPGGLPDASIVPLDVFPSALEGPVDTAVWVATCEDLRALGGRGPCDASQVTRVRFTGLDVPPLSPGTQLRFDATSSIDGFFRPTTTNAVHLTVPESIVTMPPPTSPGAVTGRAGLVVSPELWAARGGRPMPEQFLVLAESEQQEQEARTSALRRDLAAEVTSSKQTRYSNSLDAAMRVSVFVRTAELLLVPGLVLSLLAVAALLQAQVRGSFVLRAIGAPSAWYRRTFMWSLLVPLCVGGATTTTVGMLADLSYDVLAKQPRHIDLSPYVLAWIALVLAGAAWMALLPLYTRGRREGSADLAVT